MLDTLRGDGLSKALKKGNKALKPIFPLTGAYLLLSTKHEHMGVCRKEN